MIEITVNCNDDTLEINDDVHKQNAIIKLKGSPSHLVTILNEIFNRLGDALGEMSGIRLTKVDEDTRTTVGEW